MFFDQYYLIFVIPAMLIAVLAQIRVKTTFGKYSKISNQRRLTAYDVARNMLNANDLQNVKIERVAGSLTDHYDPRSNIIRLSQSVHDETSVAAIGVAAHEVGHAIQYAQGYAPIKMRAALIPVTQFGSAAAFPIAILGIFAGIDILVTVGIFLFVAVVLFQLITLPVEFNASARAIKTLEQDAVLSDNELSGAKKVLTAAALTYVAALIVAVASLLRLLLLRRRNDN